MAVYTDYDKFVEFKTKTDKDEFFYPKYDLLKEDLNKLDVVQGFQMDKTIKFNQSLMIKAIKYGMILKIRYRGDKDVSVNGSERSIYPLVLGVNKNTGNMLIRGFHLDGWSVNEGRYTEKVWRLFKVSNIINMSFTGNFFRLPPNGYKSNDRIMTEKIITKADFNEIRKNQTALIQAGKIESENATQINKDNKGFPSIIVENTNTVLDLMNPNSSTTFSQYSNKLKDLKLTFLKSVFGNDYIVVFGVMGAENKNVNLYLDKNKLLATYRVLKSITGDKVVYNRQIAGRKEFNIYNFKEKLN